MWYRKSSISPKARYKIQHSSTQEYFIPCDGRKYSLTLNVNGNDFTNPVLSTRKRISVKFVEAMVRFISQNDSSSKQYKINGFTSCKLKLEGREEIFPSYLELWQWWRVVWLVSYPLGWIRWIVPCPNIRIFWVLTVWHVIDGSCAVITGIFSNVNGKNGYRFHFKISHAG